MDRVTIAGLVVHAHHGVFAEEKQRGQRFVIDVSLDLDLRAAAASDALSDTVDYGTLAERVAGVATEGSHDLIETVAGRILDVCLEDHRVELAEVTVHKPNAPVSVEVDEVRVTMRRERGA
jgi:dihydroneopterin aldolase